MRPVAAATLALLALPALLGAQLLRPDDDAKFGPLQLGESWKRSYAEGLAEAKSLKSRQLLVTFSGASCTQCDRMDKLTIPSRAFEDLFEGKALVRLDWESVEAKALAARYEIQGPPAWLWLTDEGLVVALLGGATSQAEWFQTMQASQEYWNAYQRKLVREQAEPENTRLVYEIAVETWKRGGEAQSEARFRRLGEDPKTPKEIRTGSLAYLAAIDLEARRADDAEKHLKLLLSLTDDPATREKAELRLADVEVLRGNRPRALQLLKTFSKEHPGSPNLADVNQLIAALQGSGAPAAPGGNPAPKKK